MNLKDNDRAVSCYEKKGDLIGVFSGEKKSIKLLILDHSDIPHLQKGRGVILQKFKNGKTLFSICLDSNEDILDKKNKVLLSTKEMKKWLGKRAQAGKIEPKNLHLKIIDKLSHYVVIEDIIDHETGELFVESGKELNESIIKILKTNKAKSIKVIDVRNNIDSMMLHNTIQKDPTKSTEEALMKVYLLLRGSEAPSPESAEKFINRMC